MSMFAGAVYSPKEDDERLKGQLSRVFKAMSDSEWRTLGEIEAITGDPPASISAQLRHLRKKRFGSYVVEKRPRGSRSDGLFEYRVLPPGSPTSMPAIGRCPKTNPYIKGFVQAVTLVKTAANIDEAKRLLIKEMRKLSGRCSA